MSILSNLSFENHCVSNSPSKLDQWSKPRPAAKLVLLLARRSPLTLKERGRGEYVTSFDSFHTPQSLRDSSSILEEQPDIQLFIFIKLTLYWLLYCQMTQHREELAVDGLLVLDSFAKWNIDHLLIIVANHHIALSLNQGIDRRRSHARRQDAVPCGG